MSKTGRTDALVVCLGALILMARFSMEWLRVKKSEPAFLHEDELVVSNADGHRRIPLTSISSIRSKHSLFMVRRYRSWTDRVSGIHAEQRRTRVHTRRKRRIRVSGGQEISGRDACCRARCQDKKYRHALAGKRSLILHAPHGFVAFFVLSASSLGILGERFAVSTLRTA